MANWQSHTIDDSITRFGTGMVRVAEGDYLSELTKVSASPENLDYSEKDPYLAFDFRLTEGPDGLGKTIRYIGMLSAAKADGSGGAWGLGRVLNALGADPSGLIGLSFPSYEKFAAFAANLSKRLASQKVGLEVSDDTYSGRNNQTSIISRITGFFPAEEWALRSKPRTTPSPAPTAAPAPKAAASNGASNGAAPTPTSTASPTEPSVEDLTSSLDDEIKKLFAAPATA